MTFREKLVRLRKIKSLTQDEFASAVGVSRQAVYKWESGQSYPEVPKLLEIKLLFGISIDDLLDDTYEVELPEKKRKKRMSRADKERIEAAIRAEEGIDDEDLYGSADYGDSSVNSDFEDKDAVSVDAVTAESPVDEAEEPAAKVEDEPDYAYVAPSANDTEDNATDKTESADTDVNLTDDGETAPVNDTAFDESVADDTPAQKKGLFQRLFGKK